MMNCALVREWIYNTIAHFKKTKFFDGLMTNLVPLVMTKLLFDISHNYRWPAGFPTGIENMEWGSSKFDGGA